MQAEEQRWLVRAQMGDALAFSKLVDMYAKPVYNLCYRMLGNSQDAEDASQEAFVRAFRAIHRYDPERKFLTWLLSIAANYCIDQHRRLRPVLVAFDDAPAQYLAEKSPSPELNMIQNEDKESVQALLNTLDARNRAAVILYYWYEHSYEEIAAQLSLSESALKSRLHRARLSLAKAWQQKESKPVRTGRRTHENATI